MKCETVYFRISFIILNCYVKNRSFFEIMTKIIKDNISIFNFKAYFSEYNELWIKNIILLNLALL